MTARAKRAISPTMIRNARENSGLDELAGVIEGGISGDCEEGLVLRPDCSGSEPDEGFAFGEAESFFCGGNEVFCCKVVFVSLEPGAGIFEPEEFELGVEFNAEEFREGSCGEEESLLGAVAGREVLPEEVFEG